MNAPPISTPGGTTLFSTPVVAVVLAVPAFWWFVRWLSERLSERWGGSQRTEGAE